MITKIPFIATNLLNTIENLNNQGKKKVIKTWSRSSTIVPIRATEKINV